MESSKFINYVDKFFNAMVGKTEELINGKKEEEQLLHKTMLTDEFSAEMKWGSNTINTSIVAADVVSLESSLPLKSRDTISKASGDIPKLGIKYHKGEKIIAEMQRMAALGTEEAVVARKVLEDVPKVIKGIDIRKEIMFLQALSTGTTVIEDDENVGVGVRVSFNYKDDHFLNATSVWSGASATPISDMRRVFDKADADGNAPKYATISKKYLNYAKNSDEGKELVASYNGQVYTSVTTLPIPTKSVFLEALADEFDCQFMVINSSFLVEQKDGTRTSVKPYEEANLVFFPAQKVGRLVYGNVAEYTNPVSGVTYAMTSQGTLVSEYSKNDPLKEYTTAQASAIPVIDGVDEIYVLKANETA